MISYNSSWSAAAAFGSLFREVGNGKGERWVNPVVARGNDDRCLR